MTNARPLSVILRVPVSTRMARTSACVLEATLVVSASPTSTTVSPLPVRTEEHATIRSLTTPASVLLGLVATIARTISMSAPQTLVSMERCVMTMSTPTPVPVNLATVAPTVMSTIMTVQKGGYGQREAIQRSLRLCKKNCWIEKYFVVEIIVECKYFENFFAAHV